MNTRNGNSIFEILSNCLTVKLRKIQWVPDWAWCLDNVYCVSDGKTLAYMIHRDLIIQLYFTTMQRWTKDYDMRKILGVKVNKF